MDKTNALLAKYCMSCVIAWQYPLLVRDHPQLPFIFKRLLLNSYLDWLKWTTICLIVSKTQYSNHEYNKMFLFNLEVSIIQIKSIFSTILSSHDFLIPSTYNPFVFRRVLSHSVKLRITLCSNLERTLYYECALQFTWKTVQ